MSNTKHTPSPWRLIHKKESYKLDAWVLAKDPSSAGREYHVIDLHDQHPINEHLERRLADIKLISCAPELLEALKIIVEITGDRKTVEFDRARAAIAKAEGK
jgi:hypothetical protein